MKMFLSGNFLMATINFNFMYSIRTYSCISVFIHHLLSVYYVTLHSMPGIKVKSHMAFPRVI